jgi:hypothetical protein
MIASLGPGEPGDEMSDEVLVELAANGPLAVMATKQIAHRGGDWSAAQRWDQAAALMAPVFSSQDAQEGARALAEKRPPVWQGKQDHAGGPAVMPGSPMCSFSSAVIVSSKTALVVSLGQPRAELRRMP